jgi:glycosyltransferase involved in cell wall biosynthesis
MLYNRKDSVLIRNAVSIPSLKNNLKADISSKKNELKILYAGRITSQKNWQCLIGALALVGDRIPWSLTVCGNGDEESIFRRKITAGNFGSNIHFLGYRSDVYEIMKISDVLVLPSWYEGMPNVLIEAFAIGLPTVISEIPAHKDIVGSSQSALLFPPDSPNILADKLIFLFSNPSQLLDLSTKGKEMAKEYTIDRMVSAYVEYYQNVSNSN